MGQNKFTTTRFLACVCGLFLITLSSITRASEQGHHNHHRGIYGLETIQSSFSASETTQRLQDAILARGLTVAAVIDHAANAAGVGLDLRPTTLIIWGNASIGTQLMQSRQSIGIDLPLKFLVTETEYGHVLISYNTADFMKHRHRVQDKNEVFETIAGALESISAEAAGTVE